MKRKIVLLATFLLVAIVNSSCNFSIEMKGLEPSDHYITRNYKVDSFNKIEVSSVANVHYTQSSTDSTSVKIYGPDNYLELIEVAIADSTLMISMKKKQLKNVSRMKIMIATPNLNAVRLKGVGNIYINEPLTTPSLSIKNEGVGNIVVKELKSESVWIKTEGVGNVDISGESGKAVLLSKGIGNLKAGSLKCEEAEVVSEGIGNVSCYATGKLSATSRGIGNIRYKGSPKETKINKSGIGSIKPD